MALCHPAHLIPNSGESCPFNPTARPFSKHREGETYTLKPFPVFGEELGMGLVFTRIWYYPNHSPLWEGLQYAVPDSPSPSGEGDEVNPAKIAHLSPTRKLSEREPLSPPQH